jgi:hypothetical protein
LKDQTSYVVGTPVNRSRSQVSEKETMTLDIFGPSSEKPFASYNRTTQSWKMSEDISVSDSKKFSKTLPTSGMMRNGKLFQQALLVRHTNGKGSSLWPTPTTQERSHPNLKLTPAGRRLSKNGKSSHSLGLADAVILWPTPRASSAMSEDISKIQERLKNGKPYKSKLEEAVALWPTPRAAMGETRNHNVWLRPADKPQNLENRIAQRDPKSIGGKVNPTWVEWLMGFPLGWTDLKD